MGGTRGGAWGSVLCCSLESCTVAWVCFRGGVVIGGCAPVAANMSAICRMASMVWVPKQAKVAASAGFSRESDRHMAASLDVLAEDMSGMAPLCGKNWTVLVMRYPRVSGI